MKIINIYATHKTLGVPLKKRKYFHIDKTLVVDVENEKTFEETYEVLLSVLEKANNNFSLLEGDGIRVVITNEDKSKESVRFRPNSHGSLGVYHNWIKGQNFSPLVWKLWSFLHGKFEPLREGA